MNAARIVLAIVAALCAGAASAQRVLIINGKRLTEDQVTRLEQMNCAQMADGSYWLNLKSGAWGHAASMQRQGFIGDPCRAIPGATLIRRDRLYRPGELISEGRARPWSTSRVHSETSAR